VVLCEGGHAHENGSEAGARWNLGWDRECWRIQPSAANLLLDGSGGHEVLRGGI